MLVVLDRVREVAKKYEQLTAQLAAPETYGDPALSAKLLREQKSLEPLAAAYRRYASLQDDLRAAEELQLPSEELEGIRAEIAAAERELRRLLLPRDENDERSVFLEIRAGTGGEEAALFAADLCRMYTMYAAKRGWRTEIEDMNETELGGYKEMILSVEGEGVWSRLKYEAGTHCVKRVPETESSGRIQTSTATVAVLPELDEVDFALDPKDLRIDVFRASGAGGQKVNKTSSAIRVTHIPTGTVVECQNERSQYQNKDKALQILRGRLWEAERQKRTDAVAAARRGMVGSGERSEKIRTYFFLRGQVVEQRLEGDARTFPLQSVLDGNLDELIDRLTAAEQVEALQAETI
jgi:peptide chain release factor 1